jgi:D-arabinose 1-dehydrogenase-like Zn-dependent alcohol dehydrogenase
MAAITLSSAAHKASSTPAHLRHNLPPPVDFSSHLKPPQKVAKAQVLVQIYATAVDEADAKALEDKGRGDVGRWVPGRSFVGRVLSVGVEEKELVRGDIVIGLVDIRKVSLAFAGSRSKLIEV